MGDPVEPPFKTPTNPSISNNPSDWRVQLLVGKELELDCNLHRFTGRLRSEVLPGFGYTVYRAEQLGAMLSTKKPAPAKGLASNLYP